MTAPPSPILPQLRHQRKAARIWLVTLAGLLLYLAFTIHLCFLALGHPYQLDYGEGLVLHQALLLSRGEGIYKAINTYPYIFSNYAPLFQAVTSPLVSLLGPSFLPGRLLAVCATFGLGFVLYRLARRASGSGLAALVASLLFLGSPYIYHWAPVYRIDLPGLLLSTLGILILAHDARCTPRSIYLAGLLFVLGIYTKQSYVAAPLAALLFLLFSNRKAARHLLAALVVFGLPPFLVLEILTGGAFSYNLFVANVNPFSFALLISQLQDFVKTFAVMIILAAIGAVVGRRQHALDRVSTSLRLRVSLLDWYLLAALATILLAGKVGAWENYFFEALFMLCVYAGLGLAWLMRSQRPIVQAIAPILLVVQLVLMWHDPRIATKVIREEGAANRAIASLIAQQQGDVLSEDLGLLLVNGKAIPFFSFQYTQLARVGRWDQQWETGKLRSGAFPLVVLERGTREDPDRFQRFTREFLSALDIGYGLIGEVGKYRVYAPRPLQRELDVPFADQIVLVGYRLDEAVSSGGLSVPPADARTLSFNPYPPRLQVSLLWQTRRKMDKDYKVFVHLENAAGIRLAQHDGMPFFDLYPTSRWTQGETVRDDHVLSLPPGLPAGRYVLHVGLYDPVSGQRLARPDGSTSILVASLPLNLDTHTAPRPVHALTASFANGVKLLGYDLAETPLAPGTALTVTLHWETERYLDEDHTIFVHLVGSDGLPLAQADGPPQDGLYPTSLWNPGEYITDVHVMSIPSHLSPATYRLLVGLYDLQSGRRVALLGGGDRVLLGEVQLVAQ